MEQPELVMKFLAVLGAPLSVSQHFETYRTHSFMEADMKVMTYQSNMPKLSEQYHLSRN